MVVDEGRGEMLVGTTKGETGVGVGERRGWVDVDLFFLQTMHTR